MNMAQILTMSTLSLKLLYTRAVQKETKRIQFKFTAVLTT